MTGVQTCALPICQQPGAARFRLPAGTLLAILGIAFCLVLVKGIGRTEVVILAATTVIALLNWLWVRGRGEPEPSPSP